MSEYTKILNGGLTTSLRAEIAALKAENEKLRREAAIVDMLLDALDAAIKTGKELENERLNKLCGIDDLNQ